MMNQTSPHCVHTWKSTLYYFNKKVFQWWRGKSNNFIACLAPWGGQKKVLAPWFMASLLGEMILWGFNHEWLCPKSCVVQVMKEKWRVFIWVWVVFYRRCSFWNWLQIIIIDSDWGIKIRKSELKNGGKNIQEIKKTIIPGLWVFKFFLVGNLNRSSYFRSWVFCRSTKESWDAIFSQKE